MATLQDKNKSKLLTKDLLGQTLLTQKNIITGKTEQVISPTHFRVGIEQCDSALTVTGPILSECENATSVIFGNFIICGSLTVGGGVAGVDTKDVKVSSDDATSDFLINKIVAGNNITVTELGGGSGETLSIAVVDGLAGDPNPSFLVLGLTSSLNNERVFTPGVGLGANDAGPDSTYTLDIVGHIAGLLPVYHGFASGSKRWSSITWDAFTNVATNFIDVFQDGITRSDSQFTFVSAGFYQVDSLFNALGTDNYLGFRLTGSNGVTVLQHTDYVNALGQHRGNLAGVFEITGANDWVALEYAQNSGTAATWQPNGQLDGENMRSVNVSFHCIRIATDPT